MDELQTQIDDISTNIDDTNSNVDTVSSTVDDHENRIATAEEVTSQIDPTQVGQLIYPLTQDTIDLIKAVFPTGSVTLVGGTATVTDGRIGTNTILLYSVKTSTGIPVMAAGAPQLAYSYVLGSGTVTFNSSVAADTSVLVYVIFN